MKKSRQISLLLAMVLSMHCATAQTNNYFLHTVTKGQGLYSISRMYGVTEADIIALNPGSDVVIKVGQQLRIPQKNTLQDTKDKQIADSNGQRFHTIKTGETLYRLTVIYGLSAREICNANPGLSAENFKVGQVIVIPSPKTTSIVEESEPKVTEPNPLIGKQQENTTVQTDKTAASQTRCKTEHVVKRKENIYRLSRMYGITELELINANPELRNRKLKRGETICIPYSKNKTEHVQPEPKTPAIEKQEPTQPVIPSDESLFAESKEKTEDIEQIKAAIILPFMLEGDSLNNDRSKMVEFYEGFLLALDSLKKDGVSIDLHVYDSGNERQSISSILNLPEMRQMNIIFGPVYEKHIAEAAAFADTTGIRVVIPFDRNVDEVFTNPYLYQVNTPQSYFYAEVYDHFFRQFPHPNVIFFNSPEEDEDGIIAGFKQELDNRHAPYTILPADTATNKDTIRAHLSLAHQNILMMNSEKSGSLNNMMPVFQLLVRDTATTKYDVHLFGYPQYQVYTNNHLASFYEIDTYFYSSFYTNNLLPQAVDYHKKYRRTYSKEIVNRYPKYAILGFDISYYFLKALHLYGTDMESQLNEMKYDPIQTGFKFERVNNWGGFINRKAFFVHFGKDYQLQKIDFD